MSRRNQARRRRTYGRRQHELRERRDGAVADADLWLRDEDMSATEMTEEHRQADGDGYGFAR